MQTLQYQNVNKLQFFTLSVPYYFLKNKCLTSSANLIVCHPKGNDGFELLKQRPNFRGDGNFEKQATWVRASHCSVKYFG